MLCTATNDPGQRSFLVPPPESNRKRLTSVLKVYTNSLNWIGAVIGILDSSHQTNLDQRSQTLTTYFLLLMSSIFRSSFSLLLSDIGSSSSRKFRADNLTASVDWEIRNTVSSESIQGQPERQVSLCCGRLPKFCDRYKQQDTINKISTGRE